MKKLIILAFAILFATASSCEKKIDPENNQPPVIDKPDVPGAEILEEGQFNPNSDTYELFHEFRAAWVSTAWQTDWPLSTKTAADFDTPGIKLESMATYKEDLESLIRTIKEAGCNVVILQCVSFMDAMYESKILPWSRYLTGTEGAKPSFDPLKVAADLCHSLGMEIHVWMNPYRVGSTSRTFAASHPMKLHPEWLQTYNGSYYWNPGVPEVHEFLGSIAAEVVTNYDVDGVHIDDYFYPSGLKSKPLTWDDSKEYAKYGAGLSLEEWRYSNVDKTVKAFYDAVHAARPSAVFGVSPSGRLVNTMALYADPRRWTSFIDYLAPQIYWNNGHSVADADFYKNVVEWPTQNVPGVPVMPGIAIYRYGQEGFTYGEYELEISQCRAQNGIAGQFWYSTRDIVKHLDFMKTKIYPYASLVPKIGKCDLSPLGAPDVTVAGGLLSWEPVEGAASYAVYQIIPPAKSGQAWTTRLVSDGTVCNYKGSARVNYIVVAHNREQISPASKPVFVK